MKLLLAIAVAVAAAGTGVMAASDWTLYRASIAAADASLRLYDVRAAAEWLDAAPPAHRGWEWRYLRARLDNSRRQVQAHDGAITGVAIGADSYLVATTSVDRSVRVWSTVRGTAFTQLTGAGGTTWSPAWHPSLRIVAAMSSDGHVRIWDLSEVDLDLPSTTKIEPTATIPTGGRGLGAVAWSPDGTLLAASTWTVEAGKGVQGWVQLWRVESRELVWKAQYGVKPIPALAFREDGAQLAAGTWDGWIGLFEIPGTGAVGPDIRIAPMAGRYTAVQQLTYVGDGTLMVGTKDGLARLYRSTDGTLQHELQGHTRWVNAVAGSTDPLASIATGSSDGTLRLWYREALQTPRVLLGHRTAVTGVAMFQEARLVSGDADGILRFWDTDGGPGEPRSVGGHSTTSYGLAFGAADGLTVATARQGGYVSLHSLRNDGKAWMRQAHRESANAVDFSPDRSRLVTAGNDGRLVVHRASDGHELAAWDASGGRQITSVAWSPDGSAIASPAEAPNAALWDAATGRRLKTFAGRAGAVTSVSFSADGRWLALASANGDVRLVDVRTGDITTVPDAHAGGAQSVAFEPRGRSIATAGADRVVRLWRVPGLRPQQVLRGHTELVHGVAFSPDGSRLASASSDQTARLWSAATGESLLVLAYDDQVYGVRFSPNGAALAVQGMDGKVKLLEAPAYH
jgi:WD40 repeat protein